MCTFVLSDCVHGTYPEAMPHTPINRPLVNLWFLVPLTYAPPHASTISHYHIELQVQWRCANSRKPKQPANSCLGFMLFATHQCIWHAMSAQKTCLGRKMLLEVHTF